MKKTLVLILLILIAALSIGCLQGKTEDVNISPTFTSGSYTLQGVEGKIGILTSGFKSKVPNKYMWHFWGTKEDLAKKPFRVEAIDLKTGEKHQVLLEGMGTPNKTHVWEYAFGLGGPNNGADAHMPSGLEFPHAGKWSLEAYLGGERFGAIIVDVE